MAFGNFPPASFVGFTGLTIVRFVISPTGITVRRSGPEWIGRQAKPFSFAQLLQKNQSID